MTPPQVLCRSSSSRDLVDEDLPFNNEGKADLVSWWAWLPVPLRRCTPVVQVRPLTDGLEVGDRLSQAKADGGLGLGTTVTSFAFIAAILASSSP